MQPRSLEQLLQALQKDPRWQQDRSLRLLQQRWAGIVGPAIAAQAQPVAIQRQTLQVAVSSGAWAQTLGFERMRLLQRLRQELNLSLKDIRFSTAYRDRRSSQVPLESDRQHQAWQTHPCRLIESGQGSAIASDPLQRRRDLSRTLPRCPRCHIPSPPGELQRWNCCALCIRQQWATQTPSSSQVRAFKEEKAIKLET